MNENDYLFFFMCRKRRGWGDFNMIFKLFTEASYFFNFMNKGREQLDNLNFIKREQG
jgi:hypothetical protein